MRSHNLEKLCYLEDNPNHNLSRLCETPNLLTNLQNYLYPVKYGSTCTANLFATSCEYQGEYLYTDESVSPCPHSTHEGYETPPRNLLHKPHNSILLPKSSLSQL
ncbi:hypothetical protein V8G54_003487 [Vigna mungo]|uniref:Uncharacterized protein n=1 Tax=Vigna mungo TaxID=3915 RepID=A0AAQ3PB07_VIGMU